MQSLNYVQASDQLGNASLMTVSTVRAPGASTILTNTVANVPDFFYASMGTPHTFTDPVTSETITVISEATAVDFAGHVDGSNIEIDEIAPGYTDLGSQVGDIIIIRPITEWANNIFNILSESHGTDGSLKDESIWNEDMFTEPLSPVVRGADNIFDHVASGCVWTADAVGSTRLASCTAGVVYIGGARLEVLPVTGRAFTASKDVYCDLVRNGNNAEWVYYDNTTNAASPSFATTGGTMRGAIIVVGASSIASTDSINQGQETKLLPIASSTPYAVTDSLGNLICPRDPRREIIGYREYKTSQGSITTEVDLTGLNMTVNVPTARKISLIFDTHLFSTVAGDFYVVSFKEGSTTLRKFNGRFQTTSGQEHQHFEHDFTPTAGVHTYKVTLARESGSGSISTFSATDIYSAFKVELK